MIGAPNHFAHEHKSAATYLEPVVSSGGPDTPMVHPAALFIGPDGLGRAAPETGDLFGAGPGHGPVQSWAGA